VYPTSVFKDSKYLTVLLAKMVRKISHSSLINVLGEDISLFMHVIVLQIVIFLLLC